MWLSFRSPSFILLFLELSYFIIFLCSIYFPMRKALCWEEKEVITLKTEIQLSSLVGCTEHRGAHPGRLLRADPLLGSPFLVLLSSFLCRRISSEDSPTKVGTQFSISVCLTTQESNLGFLYCRQILNLLSHQRARIYQRWWRSL